MAIWACWASRAGDGGLVRFTRGLPPARRAPAAGRRGLVGNRGDRLPAVATLGRAATPYGARIADAAGGGWRWQFRTGLRTDLVFAESALQSPTASNWLKVKGKTPWAAWMSSRLFGGSSGLMCLHLGDIYPAGVRTQAAANKELKDKGHSVACPRGTRGSLRGHRRPAGGRPAGLAAIP